MNKLLRIKHKRPKQQHLQFVKLQTLNNYYTANVGKGPLLELIHLFKLQVTLSKVKFHLSKRTLQEEPFILLDMLC